MKTARKKQEKLTSEYIFTQTVKNSAKSLIKKYKSKNLAKKLEINDKS